MQPSFNNIIEEICSIASFFYAALLMKLKSALHFLIVECQYTNAYFDEPAKYDKCASLYIMLIHCLKYK